MASPDAPAFPPTTVTAVRQGKAAVRAIIELTDLLNEVERGGMDLGILRTDTPVDQTILDVQGLAAGDCGVCLLHVPSERFTKDDAINVGSGMFACCTGIPQVDAEATSRYQHLVLAVGGKYRAFMGIYFKEGLDDGVPPLTAPCGVIPAQLYADTIKNNT